MSVSDDTADDLLRNTEEQLAKEPERLAWSRPLIVPRLCTAPEGYEPVTDEQREASLFDLEIDRMSWREDEP